MNSFVLKIIACITMFIDHIGYVIYGKPSWLNCIGRLSFPIFAFQISEGFSHTKNVTKYLQRLFIFALISQIPFMLFYSLINDDFIFNVLFTLFFGLITIVAYNCNKIFGIFITLFLSISAHFLNFDYGFYGVIIIFLFYVFRNNKSLMIFSFIISTIIKYTPLIFQYYNYGIDVLKHVFTYYLPFILSTFFSMILIMLYNGKKGPNTKHLLYLFYPLHLLLIYGLSLVL